MVPAESEMEKETPRAVEYPLIRQAVPEKSYSGAQDSKSGGHSARDRMNELMSFGKLKMNERLKTKAGRWEKSTIAVADTVWSILNTKMKTSIQFFVAVSNPNIHVGEN